MGATVFYLATVNATTIYQFKGKDTEIKKYALCLGNIWGDFSAYNMKKTGLNGCVCNFSVDYCHQFKRKTETISWIAETQECVLPRVGIKGSWFVNQFLGPTNQKLVNLPFFVNVFFQNMVT